MSGSGRSRRRGASPETGSALPDYEANGERVAEAIALAPELYVHTKVQEAAIAQINAFWKGCSKPPGTPLPGRALSAPSQAGKSAMIAELARRGNAMPPANPHRILHVNLSERITEKMLYQRILNAIKDPEALGNYSLEVLRQRCAEFLPAGGTRLLAIDEVQLLGKHTQDNYAVAGALKDMLDAGIVAILFAGDEKAKDIFEVNNRLRGRLGALLQLPPVNPKIPADLDALEEFADALDVAIAASKLVGPSDLGGRDTMRRIGRASGGHVGRFCRIVAAALEHACARGAERIEWHDLSYAVRHLAIPATWAARNPFPEPEAW